MRRSHSQINVLWRFGAACDKTGKKEDETGSRGEIGWGGVSWQMFANAKHARISCIFTNFDIYNPLLPARLTNGQLRGQGEGKGQAGNKLKSSLNSFICLWKTLASSHTHAAHTHIHIQDTHLNDLWRKWRQVCRLSRPLALGSWPAWQCGQREANVAKSKSSWPKAGDKGGVAAWELVQYLGALEQFVT